MSTPGILIVPDGPSTHPAAEHVQRVIDALPAQVRQPVWERRGTFLVVDPAQCGGVTWIDHDGRALSVLLVRDGTVPDAVVRHEFAHALKRHKTTNVEEYAAAQREADELAAAWGKLAEKDGPADAERAGS